MIETIRKCIAMMPAGTRGGWIILAPLTLLTSATETATAATVFALFQVLNDPARINSIGWLARVVQRLPSQEPRSVILELMVLAALFHVFRSVLAVLVNYLRYRILHDASAVLSTTMLRRYLTAPYPFHLHRNSAELIRNCTTTVADVMGVVLGTLVSAVSEATVAVGLAVVVINAAPGLAVVAGTAMLILLFVVLRLTRQATIRYGEQAHFQSALRLKTLQETFGGIKEVKVLGREAYFFDEFDERQRTILKLGYQGITLGYLPAVAIQTVLVLGGLGVIAVLTWTSGPGTQVLPTIGLFGYAAMRLMPTATWLLNSASSVRGTAPAVDELYKDFLDLQDQDRGVDLSKSGAIEFRQAIDVDHVAYRYPGSAANALTEVSIRIARGESIGIVGPTGAGKSTLVDVVLGLLPPTRGRVMVDAVDLSSPNARWRRRVGYVPQALYLIDDSLRRNVALGIADGEIVEAQVQRALEMAQLAEFVGSLPDGLDTLVGERGVRLSGGERQRVAIARALYHDPDVLVFDEATSALDLTTEAEVSRTIDRLRGEKTMLVVAHRLSTVKACDRIVFLRDGRVAGIGSFEELCARNEDFRAMAALAAV